MGGELGHSRAKPLAESVERHQRRAGLSDVGAGGHFAGHAGQAALRSAHDEDLVGPGSLSGAVTALLEVRNREIEHLVFRDRRNRLLLIRGALELVIEAVQLRGSYGMSNVSPGASTLERDCVWESTVAPNFGASCLIGGNVL